MAEIDGELWRHNLTKLVVIDVSDDYLLMQPALPNDFYPVVTEVWVPNCNLKASITQIGESEGYLYDWHEISEDIMNEVTVGVVRANILAIGS